VLRKAAVDGVACMIGPTYRHDLPHDERDGREDRREWLQAVLDLLPFPALLLESGDGRILVANRAAAHLPIFPTAAAGERGTPDEWQVLDEQGEPIPAERMPHRLACQGEPLDGFQMSWQTPQGLASFLIFSGNVAAMHGYPPLTMLTLLEVTRLKETEAELRRAVAARDEFFAIATHELKNPLSSLLLSIAVLKRLVDRQEPLPVPLLTQQLEVSQRQGEHLARMIANLLDVSRIASGRSPLDVEAFDLCELIHATVERYGEEARSAGTALVVEPCLPTIGYFDRMKLEHALGNLVSNAIKYGAGRPVTVRLEADPSTVWIAVEDQGIGIDEVDQGRIFERFERATRSQKEQSLGLGLYIVRSIVEAHGGTIELRSTPGRGSTFTLRLPRKRIQRHEATSPPDHAP
jgi:signal transduction histidine kinase